MDAKLGTHAGQHPKDLVAVKKVGLGQGLIGIERIQDAMSQPTLIVQTYSTTFPTTLPRIAGHPEEPTLAAVGF